MSNKHFDDAFIDDLGDVNTEDNYFIPVWDSVFEMGVRPTKILDIACGNGAFSAYVQKKTKARLFGIDGSHYALAQAAKRDYEGLQHIDDFNVDNIDWADGSFDFCVAKDLLEHLLHPTRVLQEAFRLLSSGGHCLIHVPNHFPLYGRLKFLLTNNIDTFGYFPNAKRWDYPHIRFFTSDSFMEMADSCGFVVKADFSHHFPALPGMGKLPFGRRTGRFLAKRNPSEFAEAFTLLLEKK